MAHNTNRPRRIHLTGDGRHEEDIAAAVIKPGHLLATTNAGEVLPNACGRVIPHGVAGGRCEAKFALEDALQGRTIDDNYAIGELVPNVQAAKGDVVLGWLSEGEVVETDDFLTSNGDGSLRPVAGTEHAVAKALENVDASDSGAEGDNRIRIRIL